MSNTVTIRNTNKSGAVHVGGSLTGSGSKRLGPGEECEILASEAKRILGGGIVELSKDGSIRNFADEKAAKRIAAKAAAPTAPAGK